MRETKLPMIFASQVKDAIEVGAWIEIECVETAYYASNTFKGAWKVYVLTKETDGQLTKEILVTSRGLSPRTFVTIGGLMSYCIDLGHKPFSCPYVAGDVEVWKLGSSKVPKGYSPIVPE